MFGFGKERFGLRGYSPKDREFILNQERRAQQILPTASLADKSEIDIPHPLNTPWPFRILAFGVPAGLFIASMMGYTSLSTSSILTEVGVGTSSVVAAWAWVAVRARRGGRPQDIL